MITDLRDRFRGCLLGLAVGDALGAPFDLLDAAVIARKHAPITALVGGGRFKLKPGEYTGHTQMALCLADSLAENGNFDAADIGARFVAWGKTDPPDIGNHMRAVLERIGRGTDWKASSATVQRLTPTSADNASLARGVPVVLFNYKNPAARLENSRVQSEITHAHQECQWSSALVNSFVAQAMGTGVRDAALDRALEECKGAPGHLRKRVTLAPGKEKTDLVTGSYVLDTADCALWAMMNSDNFEHALVEAVSLGGDTDAIGAVCGAMAGAFYGARDIPERWLSALQDRERLTALADGFADRNEL